MARTLIDAAGQAHRPWPDARIVSLVPSITECLCALGLRRQLVGRTGFCVQPRRWLREVPKLGGTKDVDIERLLARRPTHVILNIDENRRELAAELAARVPVLVITHPRRPEDNLDLYRLLGGIFCRDTAAKRLAAAFERQLAACGEPARWPRRRVLYLIWRKPWMTVGRDTYISRLLARVNWQTLPARDEPRYPELTLASLRDQVDLVLLSSEPYPFRDRHRALVQAELGTALPVERVAGDLLSWYGSRAIAGLAYLQRYARRLMHELPSHRSPSPGELPA